MMMRIEASSDEKKQRTGAVGVCLGFKKQFFSIRKDFLFLSCAGFLQEIPKTKAKVLRDFSKKQDQLPLESLQLDTFAVRARNPRLRVGIAFKTYCQGHQVDSHDVPWAEGRFCDDLVRLSLAWFLQHKVTPISQGAPDVPEKNKKNVFSSCSSIFLGVRGRSPMLPRKGGFA